MTGSIFDDSVTGGKGSDLFVYTGGNDVITDYEKKDKISVDSQLSYADFAIEDKNLILDFGSLDSLTIADGADKAISFVENKRTTTRFYTAEGILDGKKKSIQLAGLTENFTASSKLVTIDGTATNVIEIDGNAKANVINAGEYGSTLNGGKGKDTLIGGSGADIFVYANKSGKDVIENYGADDKVSLGSDATIKDAKVKKGNSVIKIGNGSITVNDAITVTLTSETGNDTVFTGGVFTDETNFAVKVYGNYKGTIDLSNYAGFTTVDGSSAKKKLAINGTASDEYLIGGKGKDSLIGGAGNDTLTGGKGKDSLWGGDGTDTFIFNAGDGTDTIMDYQSGELLQLLDRRGRATDFNKATFDDDKGILTLAAKGGNVIFNNVTSSTQFNINGTTYHVSGKTLAR